jgi:TonB family protein
MKKSFLISGSVHIIGLLLVSLIMFVRNNTFAEMTTMFMPSRPMLYNQVDSVDEDAEPVYKQALKKTNIIQPLQPAGVTGYEFKETDFSPFFSADEPPIPLTPINPAYPPEAEKLGIEGLVLLKVYIDDEGIVRKIDIIKSPDDSLTRSAVETIKKTAFRPARIAGKNRGIFVHLPIRFTVSR